MVVALGEVVAGERSIVFNTIMDVKIGEVERGLGKSVNCVVRDQGKGSVA
jgi:hypothetical protein